MQRKAKAIIISAIFILLGLCTLYIQHNLLLRVVDVQNIVSNSDKCEIDLHRWDDAYCHEGLHPSKYTVNPPKNIFQTKLKYLKSLDSYFVDNAILYKGTFTFSKESKVLLILTVYPNSCNNWFVHMETPSQICGDKYHVNRKFVLAIIDFVEKTTGHKSNFE